MLSPHPNQLQQKLLGILVSSLVPVESRQVGHGTQRFWVLVATYPATDRESLQQQRLSLLVAPLRHVQPRQIVHGGQCVCVRFAQ